MRGRGNGEGAALGSAKIPDCELGGGTLDKVTLPSLDVSFSFFFPKRTNNKYPRYFRALLWWDACEEICLTEFYRISCTILWKVPSSSSSVEQKALLLEVKWQFSQRGEASWGRRRAWTYTQKNPLPSFFQRCKWVLFDVYSDSSVLCFESSVKYSNKCGPCPIFPMYQCGYWQMPSGG